MKTSDTKIANINDLEIEYRVYKHSGNEEQTFYFFFGENVRVRVFAKTPDDALHELMEIADSIVGALLSQA